MPYKTDIGKKAAKIIRNLMVWALALLLVTPLLWMISSSLKADDFDVYSFPIKLIPDHPMFKNYSFIFTNARQVNFGMAFLNSLTVVAAVTFGSFITCILAAFAFSKMNFKGRDRVFVLVLLSMVIPGEMLFIPHLVIYRSIGLIDQLPVLMIGGIFANAFGIFMVRQAFMGVPNDLLDSAGIDGASKLSIIKNVMVPLAKESIITFLLLQFTWIWNDIQGPLLWISSKQKYTITLALNMLSNISDAGTPVTMAGSVLSIIPVILLFVIFQKYFDRSVISAGIKG